MKTGFYLFEKGNGVMFCGDNRPTGSAEVTPPELFELVRDRAEPEQPANLTAYAYFGPGDERTYDYIRDRELGGVGELITQARTFRIREGMLELTIEAETEQAARDKMAEAFGCKDEAALRKKQPYANMTVYEVKDKPAAPLPVDEPFAWVYEFNDPDPQLDIEFQKQRPEGWPEESCFALYRRD